MDFKLIEEKDKLNENKKMKYISSIIELNEKLAKQVDNHSNDEEITLVLGGDHSIAIGSVAGSSKSVELDKFGVIWLDAHGDLNTDKTSSSSNVHGMPLAASMNIGNEILRNVYYEGIKVNPENVFHLGARDLDRGEIGIINSTSINMYTTEDLRKEGIDNCLEDLIYKIENKNLDKIHLSFDIDFISGEYVVGTGTRVENGFTVEETIYILDRICMIENIKSIDIVELNPNLEEDDTTAKIALEIIKTIFTKLKR